MGVTKRRGFFFFETEKDAEMQIKRGFTLVELLIVIVIIVILISLVVPVVKYLFGFGSDAQTSEAANHGVMTAPVETPGQSSWNGGARELLLGYQQKLKNQELWQPEDIRQAWGEYLTLYGTDIQLKKAVSAMAEDKLKAQFESFILEELKSL